MSGLFIALEGIDGTGKSSLARQLARQLGAQYWKPVSIYRLPGDERSPITTTCRKLLFDKTNPPSPETELFLFAADMAETARNITKDLEAGHLVIADRWYWSTIAYQTPRNQLTKDAAALIANTMGHIAKPDGVIFLHNPWDEQQGLDWAYQVRKRAGKDRFEDVNESIWLATIGQYSRILKTRLHLKHTPICTINPTADLQLMADVAATFVQHLVEGNTGPYLG